VTVGKETFRLLGYGWRCAMKAYAAPLTLVLACIAYGVVVVSEFYLTVGTSGALT